MKVALLAASMPEIGGLEVVMLRTARHVLSRGHQPVLLTTSLHPQIKQEAAAAGIEVRSLGAAAEVGWRRYLPRFERRLMEALDDCGAVNAHNFPTNVWLLRVRQHLGERAVVYCCHEPPRHLYESVMDEHFLASRSNVRSPLTRAWDSLANSGWRRLDQQAARWIPLILTNSRYTAGRIRQIYDREAIPTYFGPPMPPLRLQARTVTSTLRVLCVGRLVPAKNMQTAVDAFQQLPADLDYRVHVVGDGTVRPLLEQMVQSYGLSQRVRFLGTISEAQLEDEYAAADVVLYIPFDEPMGLVPIEAALRGVPSVVSSHAGPAEIVEDGVSGLYVDERSPSAVAQGLLKLLTTRGLRRELGAAAAGRAREMTFSTYASALEQGLGLTQSVVGAATA